MHRFDPDPPDLSLRVWLASLLVGLIFGVYFLYNAASWPGIFNVDGAANRMTIDHLVKLGRPELVSANDNQIEFSSLGTTRLLRPPLTYDLSAHLFKLSKNSDLSRSTRYRLASVVLGSATLSVVFLTFYLLSGQLLIALLGACLIALLPRYVFLASGLNDDIGAIFSASL